MWVKQLRLTVIAYLDTVFKVCKTKFSILNTEHSIFRQTPDNQWFKDDLRKQLNIKK